MDKNCSNGKRKKKREVRRDNSWDSDLVKPKTKRWSNKRRGSKEEENVYWNSEVQRSRKQKFSRGKKGKVEEYVESSKAEDVHTKEIKPKKKK